MESFADKLKRLRTSAGLTQLELAERIGGSKRAVSQWEQGHRTPAGPALRAIAAALNLPADTFAELPASPLPPAKPAVIGRPTVLVEVPLPELRRVPVIGTVGAGPATDEELRNVTGYVLASVKGEVVGYQVVGASMESEHIIQGDHVFVRRDLPPRSGEIVVAWVDKHNGMMLKTLKGKGDYQWLESDDGFAHLVTDEDKVYGAYVGLQRQGPKAVRRK